MVFERWLGKIAAKPQRLVQYVGDDTILLHGKDGVFIYIDGRDASLTPCLLRDDDWEPALRVFLADILRPGDCFIDIGANNGIHSLRAARSVGPHGLVVAFEPQRRLSDLLNRSISANLMLDQVHLRRMAIGAEAGTVHLGKFAHLSGSATLTENMQIVDREEVPIATLPAALAMVSAEIGRSVEPDVIKIDVEGFERAVWDGIKEWTLTRPRLTVVLEFSAVSYRDMGADPSAFLAEFLKYGFAISIVTANGARPCTQADLHEIASSQAQTDIVIRK